MNYDFDVCIIGTGTAGDTAAHLVHQAGLTTAIVESADLGGTCALRGCQPKKYLVVPSHGKLELDKLQERGLTTHSTLSWQAMRASMDEFTQAVPEGVAHSFHSQGIQLFQGQARFLSPYQIQVGEHTIVAKRFIIANGARPVELIIPGSHLLHTSDDFLKLPELPKSLVCIGGGFISLEFATVALAANTKVTIIHRGDQILERFDQDLVSELLTADHYQSLRLITNAEPLKIEFTSYGPQTGRETLSPKELSTGKYRITLSLTDGSEKHTQEVIEADWVMAAPGRISNADTLGLEHAQVEFSSRGIPVHDDMTTSQSHIYGAGDCVQGIQLSPVSDAQARVAARNCIQDLLGKHIQSGTLDKKPRQSTDRQFIDLTVLPTVIFTYPQLAQFGLSEQEVLKSSDRQNIQIVKGSGAGWPNYRRLNESHMSYKVMIEKATGKILGASLLAPQAGELINLLALAGKTGIPAWEFKEFPWAYPTYTADLKYMMGTWGDS